jgi:dienelactone hydrolase
MPRTPRLILVIAFAVVSALPNPAAAASSYVAASSTVRVACAGTTTVLPVTWYFPQPQTAAGLVWLQHGFFRANENVADLASRLARAGFVVFAPTIASLQGPCTFNNVTDFVPNLAALFADLSSPRSQLLKSARSAATSVELAVPALPSRFVFSGHSAGGSAATLVAKEYVTRFPSIARRLRGLVLLDPVENAAQSMAASLPALSQVPVLTVSAYPTLCNANSSGTQALLAAGRPFVGFEVTTGSHCDAEGASGNPVLCGLVCGPVQFVNVLVLQTFAVAWTADLLLGRSMPALYPGGDLYEAIASAGVIRTY